MMTWASQVVTFGSGVLVVPLILVNFSKEEIAVWFVLELSSTSFNSPMLVSVRTWSVPCAIFELASIVCRIPTQTISRSQLQAIHRPTGHRIMLD